MEVPCMQQQCHSCVVEAPPINPMVSGRLDIVSMQINPLLTIGNSLKKLISLYKVLTPSIKPSI